MSNEKFTSGEWHAKVHGIGGLNIGIVYINGGGFDVSGAPDCVANAHLIASAPDMYREIQSVIIELQEVIEDYPIGCPDWVLLNSKIERKEKLLSEARGE